MGMFLSVQAPSSAHSCCDALASIPQLTGRVYYPGDVEYHARLQTYHTVFAAQEPWCMVMPQNDEDVSKIAGVISKQHCPFGIRSGGHATWKGSNGVKDGVTIDFGGMNVISYDRTNKIVSIEPGATSGEIYKFLDQFNVTIVGPRSSAVSLGGFVTGGGYSFYSNAYGLACDTVTNFRVILASGEAINANEDSNPDLWKALKGGSGNFGFVTRFDMKIVPSNKMHSHYLTYDSTKDDAIFKEHINYINTMDEDPSLQASIGIYSYQEVHRVHAELLNADSIKIPPAFTGFFASKTETHTITSGTMSKLAHQITGPKKATRMHTTWTTSMFSCDIRILRSAKVTHTEYYNKMKLAAPGAKFSLFSQWNPITASMIAHSHNAGGNVLGLDDITSSGPVYLVLITLNADTAETHKKLGPLLTEFRDAMNEYARHTGLNKNWEYINYALGDQTPIKQYGYKAVEFLKATAQKYDPHEVFQDLRSTGFKIKDSAAVRWEGF